jgi:hypothetical protein
VNTYSCALVDKNWVQKSYYPTVYEDKYVGNFSVTKHHEQRKISGILMQIFLHGLDDTNNRF